MKSKQISNLIALLLCFSPFITNIEIAKAQIESSDVRYQIQPGDTLGSIAIEFGISLESLIQANNISNPDAISPGLIIVIPGLSGIDGVLSPIILGLNESIESLARQYNFAQDKILKLNKITSLDELYIGTKLLIPISADTESSKIFRIDYGLSPLEISLYLDTTIDQIALLNNLDTNSQLFPGDIISLPINKNITALPMINNFEVSISPLPLVQGVTASIRIVTDSTFQVTGNLDGNELNFKNFGSPDNYYALQGIHAMATPGLTKLLISVKDSNEIVNSVEYTILLLEGNFQVDDPIIVDPLTLDPLLTKPETDLVHGFVSNNTTEKLWAGIFQSPAYYQEYTSLFGSRRTYNDDPTITFHGGLDFGGGETLPIFAPADGIVVFSGFLPIRGYATFINHGFGVFTGYFHQSLLLVSEGEHVVKSQKIGEVGNTGRVGNANDYPGAGAHLHWEIWVNGVQVNPLDWLSIEYP